MTRAEIARAYPIGQLLHELNINNKGGKWFQCPHHKNGQEKNYSAMIADMKNKLYCNACGWFASPIDLYCEVMNVDIKTAIDRLSSDNVFSFSKAKSSQTIAPAQEKEKGVTPTDNIPSSEKYLNSVKYFVPYDKCLAADKAKIDDFLNKRKLYHALEMLTLNGYQIGVAPYENYKNIAFNFPQIKLLQSRVNQLKYNFGSPIPLLIKALKPTKDGGYWIVEGVTDGLAVAEMGNNAIVLNGAGNYTKLKLKSKYNYVLALDNDERGIETTQKLQEKWTGISFEVWKHPKNCKDMGDFNRLYNLNH